jgi:hypothetical protein
MNNYEDWAQLVAKKLEGEADLIAAIDKDELDDAAATDAFIRAVLEPFLPENFGVGSGRIVDAFGNYSDHLDVVVYNRDFPRIGLRATQAAYLYESVLAAFSIRAKFLRKTFFDSLNACASLSHLETNIDKAVLVKLAKKNGLKPGPNKRFVHDDPLRTARFELIGRPPAFVFGFSGFKYSHRQLQENIELWIDNRRNVGIETPMKSLPAVIATQGCFAWRNAAPLALSNREMLGVGNDDAPVRLIVLQLLYLLNRRLNVTADGYGLKPSLNAYLSQFSAPKFEVGVGNVAEVVNIKDSESTGSSSPDAATRAARDTARFEAARDHHASTAAAARPEASRPEAAPEPEPPAAEAASAQNAEFDKPSPFASAPIPPAAQAGESEKSDTAAVFDKPSPFASAPTPAPAKANGSEKSDTAAVFDKPSSFASAQPSPFASAPIPPAEPPAAEKPEPMPSPSPAAPLGSAPIPTMETPAAASEPRSAAAGEIAKPAKPPVDIDLGLGDDAAANDTADDDDQFIETVVIPPNAGAAGKEKSRNSTDAFIARVKEQLSSSEPLPGNEQDFTSTIPQ